MATFAEMKVKHLRQLLSEYKRFHTIKGAHKMRKQSLVQELESLFVIHEEKLYLKRDVDEFQKRFQPKPQPKPQPQEPKPQSNPQPYQPQAPARQDVEIPQSNATRRLNEKVSQMEARLRYGDDTRMAARLKGRG
jgi:FtsZ-interacting cell division protein YlmF